MLTSATVAHDRVGHICLVTMIARNWCESIGGSHENLSFRDNQMSEYADSG